MNATLATTLFAVTVLMALAAIAILGFNTQSLLLWLAAVTSLWGGALIAIGGQR